MHSAPWLHAARGRFPPQQDVPFPEGHHIFPAKSSRFCSRWALISGRHYPAAARDEIPQRLVIMRYGSLVPLFTISSISTPIYPSDRLQNQRLLALYEMRRIDAANQPLRRRFLIAGGAVELPCAEQTRNILEFQRQFQLCCINAVIFNGIGKARNLAMLQTGNRAVHSNLHSSGREELMP